jgi:hypothetical protein
VPTFSLDDAEYRQRVHTNGRAADQNFGADESLFRRFPKESLVNGWPMPLTVHFDDTGISVNRSRYSLPQDVLEPDCCDGYVRVGQVVLEFLASDIPAQLPAEIPAYRFVLRHVPLECCYAHSVIWVNEEGDIERPCLKPSKTVRNLFRAELLTKMQAAGRVPREFLPRE